MASPAIGAITSGVNYQVRFFWLQALPMLVRDGIERVEMEHHKADGVDDIVVFYSPSGKNDAGELTDVDFFQAKYHVDQRETIDSEFFTATAQSGTQKPLLERFADTWLQERENHPRCRLTFFTTWKWDTADKLLPFFKENGHLKESFLSESDGSAVGKIRQKWFIASGLSEENFKAFILRLRFYAPWSTFQIESQLRDGMQLAGLEVPQLGQEGNRLDDLGNKFLSSGRIKWNRSELYEVLEREKLFAKIPVTRHPMLSVRSFTRFAGLGLQSGDVDIDLTDLFNGRQPYSADAWSQDIPMRLTEKLPDIAKLAQPIELALDCHLSIAWHLGMLLDSKSGIQTILRQKTNAGTVLWEPVRNGAAVDEWILEEEREGNGDLIVIASLTHPAKEDVLRSLPYLDLDKGRLMHFTHPNPSNNAVRDGDHALALVTTLVTRVRDAVSKNPVSKIHLFFSAPVSFAFLLGQNSGVLGPTTAYEYGFKGTKNYSPGASSTTV